MFGDVVIPVKLLECHFGCHRRKDRNFCQEKQVVKKINYKVLSRLKPSLTGKPCGNFDCINSRSLLNCLNGAITSHTSNKLEENHDITRQITEHAYSLFNRHGEIIALRVKRRGLKSLNETKRFEVLTIAMDALNVLELLFRICSRPKSGGLPGVDAR